MVRNHNNQFRCWCWFANNHQEELYNVIDLMIKDKIEELLPQMVEELLRQKIDNLSFNIQTTINGRTSHTFKDIITDEIIKELSK